MKSTTSEELGRKVRAALGLPEWGKPVTDQGETETRVIMWSVDELNDAFARVGGTVTAQDVTRTPEPGRTYRAVEITITADLPGIGEVQATTDWAPEHGGLNLPVMRALPANVWLDLGRRG